MRGNNGCCVPWLEARNNFRSCMVWLATATLGNGNSIGFLAMKGLAQCAWEMPQPIKRNWMYMGNLPTC